jgi:hypothetical protein
MYTKIVGKDKPNIWSGYQAEDKLNSREWKGVEERNT